ncbi:ArsR/SmtB family transcription factor [Arcanobacterium pinnipediorum]|uniref:Metalloregulator ArsR/SmtB family transcription factor n=1 Tax=Arcanobacterium pinnipediorum TaxID=1503041 RepID=A0ABY5AI03_9ACTO|nr:metalloregulator ArsR/SmtB family transcription factor [Arcanobacterium pinnipediorum]USR79832.1 metalloregulator ArsR/SmtB family transcription factor [Arcanobacterium pinnipediorum]
METSPDFARVAEMFKVLGNESRLELLVALDTESMTVSQLARQTHLSQPLVSQHLRTLRTAGMVTATRQGREVIYQLADEHVAHVVTDAIIHAHEKLES